MQQIITERGFQLVANAGYPPNADNKTARVVQQSSAIGDYEDSYDRPGTSFLWMGESLHLDREEVAEVVEYMQTWLKTGKLFKE